MQLIHICIVTVQKILLDANSNQRFNLENIVLMSIHADPVRSTDLNKPSSSAPRPLPTQTCTLQVLSYPAT
jgi:hypothetical protein